MRERTIEELADIYPFVGLFSKYGLAVARNDNGWLHIRRDGTPLYPERYDYARLHIGGIATVYKGEEKISLNLRGKRVDTLMAKLLARLLCWWPWF